MLYIKSPLVISFDFYAKVFLNFNYQNWCSLSVSATYMLVFMLVDENCLLFLQIFPFFSQS